MHHHSSESFIQQLSLYGIRDFVAPLDRDPSFDDYRQLRERLARPGSRATSHPSPLSTPGTGPMKFADSGRFDRTRIHEYGDRPAQDFIATLRDQRGDDDRQPRIGVVPAQGHEPETADHADRDQNIGGSVAGIGRQDRGTEPAGRPGFGGGSASRIPAPNPKMPRIR